MWETRTVNIIVRLPNDIADQAEKVQQTDLSFYPGSFFMGSLGARFIINCEIGEIEMTNLWR